MILAYFGCHSNVP